MKKSKHKVTYARQLLDRLILLDEMTVAHYYEMGQLFSAIEHGKLAPVLGYQSLAHLIIEELSFSPATAYGYLHVFRNFNRLKYNKTEALYLLGEFGITRMKQYLSQADKKQGRLAILRRIKVLRAQIRQINFTLSGDEHVRVMRLFGEMGITRSDSGRLLNSSEMFLGIVDMAERYLVEHDKRTPAKLRAVK